MCPNVSRARPARAGTQGNAGSNAEGRRGRGKAPRATLNILEQIWDTFGKIEILIFFGPKKVPSLALNGRSGLDLEPKSRSGAKSRPQRGSDRKSQRRRTKMKITRAVELRFSKFWKFWKAEMFLLNLLLLSSF